MPDDNSTDLSPAENPAEQSPDEIRDEIAEGIETEGPGNAFEIEKSTERDAFDALRPRDEEPEEAVDPGPSDAEIHFQEGYTADDERWLSEYGEIVEGLREPKTPDDIRANAQAVKAARAEFEAEGRAELLEAREVFAQAQSLLDEGEADEHEIADALREARPELLGHFVQNWAQWDPEAAESYWLEAVAEAGAERIERDRRVREQAAWEQQGAIAKAFDERIEKANLTERGQELVKEIVSLSPGALAAIEMPAQAAERAGELVRGAIELGRASEEQEIRRGIAAAANKTDQALGWSEAEPVPEIDFETRIRSANVFRESKPKRSAR